MNNEQIRTQGSNERKDIENASLKSERTPDSAVHKKRGVFSSLIGINSIKRNTDIIKKRASFPLLRRVLKNELKATRLAPEIVQAEKLSTEDIDRSLFWHTVIIAITIPALIWSIFILTNALAIGIKFDIWNPTMNQGLYTSIPIILFTASKLYVSWCSRKAFRAHNKLMRRDA